ncbi:MAG: hypothetical protein V1930_05655 [Pseudomonadota bacterium]
MGHLLGLQEYIDEMYKKSIFEEVLESKHACEYHLHGQKIVIAEILENLTYDLKVKIEGQGEEVLPKIQIKLLYPADSAASIRPLIKIDKKVLGVELAPIVSPTKRYFVKNKSLFPLMKNKDVVFFTLLEGEIIKGVISGFSRYEITVQLKGGLPVTILRHSIYDLRNKRGRCFLKSHQEDLRDWEKSDLYITN